MIAYYDFYLRLSMISINDFAASDVLSFEIVFNYKNSLI